MMKLIFLVILITVLVLVIEFFKSTMKGGLKKEEKRFPYLKKFYLMTKAEHEFFKVLNQIVENRFYIVPQVHLSEIVLVNKYERHYKTYLSKIDKKSVDYVLFDKENFTPLLVIELDDPTHEQGNRKERDQFVEQLLDHIKLPLLRYKNQSSYDSELIKNEIKIKLGYH